MKYLLPIALILLALPLAASTQITDVHASVHENQLRISYLLTSDQPLQHVTTDTYIPSLINHQDTQTTNQQTLHYSRTYTLPANHQATDVHLRVQARNQPAHTLKIPLNQQAPQQPAPTPTQNPLTIEVDPVRDIIPGDRVYYRVQLTNHAQTTQTTRIGLTDVSSWATYRVDPNPQVTVQAGETKDVYIYLRADQQASPGTKYFDVTAQSPDAYQAATVKLAVLQPLDQQTTSNAPWILLIAGILLVLAAILLLTKRHEPKKPTTQGGDEEDDFITFY